MSTMAVNFFDLNKRAGEPITDEVKETVAVLSSPLPFKIRARPKQERFRTTTRNRHRDAHDIITVYDVADKESFNNVMV